MVRDVHRQVLSIADRVTHTNWSLNTVQADWNPMQKGFVCQTNGSRHESTVRLHDRMWKKITHREENGQTSVAGPLSLGKVGRSGTEQFHFLLTFASRSSQPRSCALFCQFKPARIGTILIPIDCWWSKLYFGNVNFDFWRDLQVCFDGFWLPKPSCAESERPLSLVTF